MRCALALLVAVTGLAFTGSATAATNFTSSSITTPVDPAFPLFTSEAPNQLHVEGTTSGGDSNADIVCFRGVDHLLLASNVTVTANAFSTDVNLSGIAAGSPMPYCVLRAVPTGDITDYPPDATTDFTGPHIGVGRYSPFKVTNVGINLGAIYDYLLAQGQPKAYIEMLSAGGCGVSYHGLVDPTTLAESDPSFYCNSWFLQRDGCTTASGFCQIGTRSEIQVDGKNAYLPAMARGLYGVDPGHRSTLISGFPAFNVDKSIDPLTGNLHITETDGLAKCSPNETAFHLEPSDPAWPSDCSSFMDTGVKLVRTIDSDREGRRITIADEWQSIDGKAHELDLLYEQDYGGDGGNFPSPSFQYSWVGGNFSPPALGEVVGGPSTDQPVTILADTNAGVADEFQFPQSAETWSDAPSQIRWYYRDTGFYNGHVHFTRTVPAGGSVTIRSSYIVGLTKDEVNAQVAEEQARLGRPKIAFTSSAGVDNSAYLATGTATDPAGGITGLTVNGDAVGVGGDGSWSKALTLAEGDNTITATATDTSGNTTTVAKKVTFTPPQPPAPVPVPTPAASDRTAPALGLAISRTRLAALLRKGLPVKVRCSEPCTFSLTLKQGRTTIGKLSGRLTAAGTKKVTVKLTKKAKKRLRKARRVRLTLSLTAKDTAGNTARKTAKTTVRR